MCQLQNIFISCWRHEIWYFDSKHNSYCSSTEILNEVKKIISSEKISCSHAKLYLSFHVCHSRTLFLFLHGKWHQSKKLSRLFLLLLAFYATMTFNMDFYGHSSAFTLWFNYISCFAGKLSTDGRCINVESEIFHGDLWRQKLQILKSVCHDEIWSWEE